MKEGGIKVDSMISEFHKNTIFLSIRILDRQNDWEHIKIFNRYILKEIFVNLFD